jgi:zinc transport system substrate-binding protein
MMLRSRLSWRAASLVAVPVLALAACGSDNGDAGSGGAASGSVSAGDTISVEASFYPLLWMAQQVGGDRLDVSSLTKPGAEPHDLELTPRDVADITDADVVVYLGGFQPAVDDAVKEIADSKVFDAAPGAELDLTYTPIEEGEKASGEAGSTDPHFWLDPTRLAAVGDDFATYLAKLDPDHADAYRANAASLADKLAALDHEFKAGVASCANKDLVTSHNAFGYLARRYGLTQVGITGLTPEEEPSPGELASVTDFVKTHRVRTIYFETLVGPAVAKAVAGETGARTDVLDPIEGLNDHSQGNDYLEVMRSNLANIERGQPCR